MEIKRFVVRELLPDTKYYMTYDGSITMPACHETTTWIILNKPIYITKQQLLALRQLMQGDKDHPNAPLGNNFRPPQPLHHRPVRTNIDFNVQGPKNCPTMNRDIYYKGMKSCIPPCFATFPTGKSDHRVGRFVSSQVITAVDGNGNSGDTVISTGYG
ncbi:Carbonic anhydrase-related protein [Apis cerana cerana]|uniref:Carbonic anhydrase-related protein n=1 Tax=Apis cerana cerana TaxID=94128 RepID=A0A2A3ESZ7_APICC|nr:Carbonic anhydrase-related protein [Apis cerana cerana]